MKDPKTERDKSKPLGATLIGLSMSAFYGCFQGLGLALSIALFCLGFILLIAGVVLYD